MEEESHAVVGNDSDLSSTGSDQSDCHQLQCAYADSPFSPEVMSSLGKYMGQVLLSLLSDKIADVGHPALVLKFPP